MILWWVMPVEMERALRKAGKKKGLSKERLNAYIYGAMRDTGWKPSREKGRHKEVARP